MVKGTKRQIRQLKTALRWKIPAARRERIQMVLLRESGMAQPAIAAAMGVSLSTDNRAHIHGAGRLFGRKEAKRRFTRAEMEAWLQSRGVTLVGAISTKARWPTGAFRKCWRIMWDP